MSDAIAHATITLAQDTSDHQRQAQRRQVRQAAPAGDLLAG